MKECCGDAVADVLRGWFRKGYTGVAELTILSSVEYDSRLACTFFHRLGPRKVGCDRYGEIEIFEKFKKIGR